MAAERSRGRCPCAQEEALAGYFGAQGDFSEFAGLQRGWEGLSRCACIHRTHVLAAEPGAPARVPRTHSQRTVPRRFTLRRVALRRVAGVSGAARRGRYSSVYAASSLNQPAAVLHDLLVYSSAPPDALPCSACDADSAQVCRRPEGSST